MTSDPINPPERGSGTTRRTFIAARRDRGRGPLGAGAAGRLRDHLPDGRQQQRQLNDAHGSRRPAAGAPRPSGDAADLRRQQGDRLRPLAREGTAAVLQLGPVHQHRRRQGVREEVRRQGSDQHVHDDRRGGREDLERHRPVRRVRARAGVPRAARRRQGPAAAEPQLHPQPHGQRVAVAAQPLVRRRRALHGSVHDLHDRNRLARRQAAGLQPGHDGEPLERAVGGGPEDLRQGRAARRPARGPRDGPAPQRRHRRQHRGPEADQRRPRTRWST